MIEKTRFDLPLVLPEVRDVADGCVERLLTVLRARDGVEDYEYLYLLRQQITAAKAAGRDTTAAAQALSAAAGLVTIPNPGGRYSAQILPHPERLYAVRQQLAAAIESLAKASGH